MTRTQRRPARPGYTLVELLVVMSLIILLAALALGVSQTGMFGSQKVISAGDRVSGWLLIAKQRAVRDGAPRGVRFFSSPGDPTRFTEAQYIESPEAWVPNPGQETNPTGARIVFSIQWWKSPVPGKPNVVSSTQPTWNAAGDPTGNVNPPKCYYASGTSSGGSWVVSAAVLSDMSEFDQRVSIGDSLTLPEFGKNFRITGINASVTEVVTIGGVQVPPSAFRELGLMNTPDFSAAGTEHPSSMTPAQALTRPGSLTTYKFGFQRSPQPLLGEPALQLTGGTAIDYRLSTVANPYKTSFGGAAGPYNPPTSFGVSAIIDTASVGGLSFDIIFAPSGQVLNNNAGLICLWVRDTSKGVAHPRLDPTTGACDPSVVFDAAGQQALVVLNTKNGLISTQEIIPPPPGANPTTYDPYRTAKDGINNGL